MPRRPNAGGRALLDLFAGIPGITAEEILIAECAGVRHGGRAAGDRGCRPPHRRRRGEFAANLLDPDVVVIGGELARSGETLLASAACGRARRLLDGARDPQIVASASTAAPRSPAPSSPRSRPPSSSAAGRAWNGRLMAGRARRSWPAVLTVLVGLALASTGCAPAPASDTVVALLLPESATARYERLDRPLFEERLAAAGDHRLIHANAGGSASRQLEQAESALAAGASVLVEPRGSDRGTCDRRRGGRPRRPRRSYDRLIDGGGAAFYVSFDNERVGTLQAEGLVAGMDERGTPGGAVLVLAGDPNDANTTDLEAGSSRVLEDAGIPVLARYDVPGRSAARAQDWMATQASQFGERIDGIYAGNDGLAGAAVAALRSAGVTTVPVVVGQDADLSAVRRLLVGTQYATVFKDIAEQVGSPRTRRSPSRPAASRRPTARSTGCRPSCSSRCS